MASRRDVLRTTTAAGAASLLGPWPRATHAASVSLYSDLLRTWCDRLLELQIDAPQDPTRDGALRCPACSFLHGRCHDAAYPLLHLAHVTGERRYLDAAVRLQRWSDNVSDPDGAFRNELAAGSWRGITVFAVIALAEALHHHGAVLDPRSRARWQERLASAARFLDGFVTMQTGNINYPVTSALAFTWPVRCSICRATGIAAARSRTPRSPISRRAACCSARAIRRTGRRPSTAGPWISATTSRSPCPRSLCTASWRRTTR